MLTHASSALPLRQAQTSWDPEIYFPEEKSSLPKAPFPKIFDDKAYDNKFERKMARRQAAPSGIFERLSAAVLKVF